MKQLIFGATLLAFVTMTGCKLNKMVKLAEEQDLTVSPNPLELHGDSVSFKMSALLPKKMLKKNTVYTIDPYYKFAGEKKDLGPIDFKKEDYPDADEKQPEVSVEFSFEYKEAMKAGTLAVKGIAKTLNGKQKTTPEFPVAPGVITTSQLVHDLYYPLYAAHEYNPKPELKKTHVNFYYKQGSPHLRRSEKNSDRGKKLDNFVASKNITKTVTITGMHSPEGPERVNSDLAKNRAKAVKDLYKKLMNRYDYSDSLAKKINFVLKDVIESWEPLRKKLKETDKLSEKEKQKVLDIVNVDAEFEKVEDKLHKLDFYNNKLLHGIYKDLRVAKTEIISQEEKLTKAQIANLAKKIINDEASVDTLSFEQLSYAATLTPLQDEKLSIYEKLVEKKDNWKARNNLAAIYLTKAAKASSDKKKKQFINKAQSNLEIAKKKKATAPVYSNMAVVNLMKGNEDKATEIINKATGESPQGRAKDVVNAIKGTMDIMNANYESAVSRLANTKDTTGVIYNRSLAHLLKNDYDAAKKGFDALLENHKKHAHGYYLNAVTAARMGNEEEVYANLKKAVDNKSSLRDRALEDLEFRKYHGKNGFKNAVK